MGVAYKPYKTPQLIFFASYFELHSLMSRFANESILSTPSRFIRQCKMNIQSFCLFVIFVSAIMLGAIKIGFRTSISFCVLTHIFFWLNTENNADPYIIKPPSL